MSFRKRSVGIQNVTPIPDTSTASEGQTVVQPIQTHDSAPAPGPGIASASAAATSTRKRGPPRGVRPSPLDGSPIVSTGTWSLDGLLAGYGGLVLGHGILIEESGATDYAGTLLRYYAAEGIVQGHHVHVVGAGEQWARDLPGLARTASTKRPIEMNSHRKKTAESPAQSRAEAERMKIAWRYERFGQPAPNARGYPGARPGASGDEIFCHEFDLTKRLERPSDTQLNFHHPRPANSTSLSPFTDIIAALEHRLSTTPESTIHRIIIPGILSPAFYPPSACLPQHVLRFFHALRSLLRDHSSRLTAMVSLQVSLYPRETGLTRWIELLSDGVLELVPFPHTIDTGPSLSTSGAATAQEEKPQGMAKLHRLPVFHERGGGISGTAGIDDDLAFTVTRKRFEIKPFSLPPIEGDTEAQKGEADPKPTKAQLEF